VSSLAATFNELEICLSRDMRKSYHVLTYAKHANRYYERFNKAEEAQIYLNKALAYVNDELLKPGYKPYTVFQSLKNNKVKIEMLLKK
jgi:hypothetical protein